MIYRMHQSHVHAVCPSKPVSYLNIVSQLCAVTVSGLCFRGWMLYPALAFGALQNITEPCLQAVMATFVGADRQGGLQVRWFLPLRVDIDSISCTEKQLCRARFCSACFQCRLWGPAVSS